MKRSAPYPTFRYWLNDESGERLPITATSATEADGLSASAIPADGQLLIGSTGNPPVTSTITAGTGISVTNGPGSITVTNTQGNLPSQTDGQLLIGSTGLPPVAAALTAGNNVSITNAAGSITINADQEALPSQNDGELLVGLTGNTPVATTLTAGAGISIANGPASITISQNLLQVTKVTSATTETITSLTDTVITGMSITPGAGDFLVFFDGRAEQDNDASALTVSMYHDGVQVPNTEQQLNKKDIRYHIGANAYVTGVLAGEVIDIRWRVTQNQGFIYNRSLIAVKLAE